MDAASVLPCLALDVKQGDMVLDLCAAPGGKSLALLQTQLMSKSFSASLSLLWCSSADYRPRCFHVPGFLCVNDSSESRTKRLKQVLRSYIPKQFLTDDKLRITSFDGTMWGDVERNSFDRVSSQSYLLTHFSCLEFPPRVCFCNQTTAVYFSLHCAGEDSQLSMSWWLFQFVTIFSIYLWEHLSWSGKH